MHIYKIIGVAPPIYTSTCISSFSNNKTAVTKCHSFNKYLLSIFNVPSSRIYEALGEPK